MRIWTLVRVAGTAGLSTMMAAACGSKTDAPPGGTGNTTTAASASGGTTSGGGQGQGGMGQGGGSATTASSTASASVASASASTSASTSASSSSAASSSSSGGGNMVNGCTGAATAQDKTAMMTVDATALGGNAGWAVTYQACVKVKAGSTVKWTGNFTFHPMGGGAPAGTLDANSPITTAAAANVNGKGQGTLNVTFPQAGTFPFYCTAHLSSMQGVIYVQ